MTKPLENFWEAVGYFNVIHVIGFHLAVISCSYEKSRMSEFTPPKMGLGTYSCIVSNSMLVYGGAQQQEFKIDCWKGP